MDLPLRSDRRRRRAVSRSSATAGERRRRGPTRSGRRTSGRASSITIGVASIAPITARQTPRSGSSSTAPIASANSPGLAAELVVAPARRGGELRDAERHEDLGRPRARSRTTPSMKSSTGDVAPSRRPCDDRLGADAASALDPVGGGVGVARGCRRSCRGCAPRGRRCCAATRRQRAAGHVGNAPVLDLGVRDAGAEDDRVRRAPRRACSSAMRVTSTSSVGLREAQVEHRPERLAAGEDLHDGAVARRSSASAPPRDRAGRS